MYTNIHGLPQALVDAIVKDSYVGGGDISVTTLTDTPQRRVLKKKYSKLIVEDVIEKMFSLYGQIVHGILERSEKKAVVEERLYMEVNGWQLSGQLDRLLTEEKAIEDWKTLSVFKKNTDGFEKQLNVYRLLAHKNGYEVNHLRVLAFYRDWRSFEQKRGGDYPEIPFKTIEIPVWTIEEAEAYVASRIAMHQSADRGEVTECTDEDRWKSQTTYALIKEGGKRATKVALTKEELGEPAKGFVIEERRGEYRRCAEFCEVAPFCPQLLKEKKLEEECLM
jgi:hypothetical protein